ncbi:UNVERIFIED_CONTAM: LOB domain-containing protein 22 [Sesamum calycinum]|uniref:LOB domain-containing protein 22 n=1 Tax=Sesamum calycinum TaxID=2727403 RepID=A0AAW2M052_9LAMI
MNLPNHSPTATTKLPDHAQLPLTTPQLSNRGGPGASLAQACAACKYQRRRCAPDCPLAPFFPADRVKEFLNAHKLFGVGNIIKILKKVPQHERQNTMRSVIFEANVRARDPVGGCHRLIREMEERLQLCNSELDLVMKKLAFYKYKLLLNDERPNSEIYDLVQNTTCKRAIGVGSVLFAGCSDEELIKVEMVEQFLNDMPTRLLSNETEDSKPDVFVEKHKSKESKESCSEWRALAETSHSPQWKHVKLVKISTTTKLPNADLPFTIPEVSDGGPNDACLLCKLQNRICPPSCSMSLLFGEDKKREVLNVHRLFRGGYIVKTLETVPHHQRQDAIRSLIFEANMREADPVGGCHCLIRAMERRLHFCCSQLELVLKKLAFHKFQVPQNDETPNSNTCDSIQIQNTICKQPVDVSVFLHDGSSSQVPHLAKAGCCDDETIGIQFLSINEPGLINETEDGGNHKCKESDQLSSVNEE